MLEVCPRCGYSLQGLPTDHACPECGLRYDAGSAIYRASQRKLLSAMVGGAFGWLFGGVQLFHAYIMSPPRVRMVLFALLAAYVGGFVWAARYSYRLLRSGPMVALLPEGLFIRLQRLDGELIPWSNIARAAANKSMKSAALFIRDAKMVRDIAGVFRAPADVERFADQVNERVRAATNGATRPAHDRT